LPSEAERQLRGDSGEPQVPGEAPVLQLAWREDDGLCKIVAQALRLLTQLWKPYPYGIS